MKLPRLKVVFGLVLWGWLGVSNAAEHSRLLDEFRAELQQKPDKLTYVLEDALYLNPSLAVQLISVAGEVAAKNNLPVSQVLQTGLRIYPEDSETYVNVLGEKFPKSREYYRTLAASWKKKQQKGEVGAQDSPLENFLALVETMEAPAPDGVEAEPLEVAETNPYENALRVLDAVYPTTVGTESESNDAEQQSLRSYRFHRRDDRQPLHLSVNSDAESGIGSEEKPQTAYRLHRGSPSREWGTGQDGFLQQGAPSPKNASSGGDHFSMPIGKRAYRMYRTESTSNWSLSKR